MSETTAKKPSRSSKAAPKAKKIPAKDLLTDAQVVDKLRWEGLDYFVLDWVNPEYVQNQETKRLIIEAKAALVRLQVRLGLDEEEG